MLTGGAGYIGSHTAVVLIESGYDVILYDSLINSRKEVIDRIETIVGKQVPLVQGDVRDTELLIKTLKQHQIESVIHFAGLKAVGESVEKPIEYYDNNIGGTISLLKAMEAVHVGTLVFSSSATVYGEPQYLPLDEEHLVSAANPYGRSKLHAEEILADMVTANKISWSVVTLRYFNPVGTHESGLIGEAPNGIPNNLMPYIAQVASGKLPHLNIFGDDYRTPDGTGVRDYIHVMDLAEGHLAALNHLNELQTDSHGKINQSGQLYTYNLGTGCGYSVFEMVEIFEQASGQPVPYLVVPRRPGDIAMCYAAVGKAKKELFWEAKRDLQSMCKSTWQFQQYSTSR